jgi:alpha-1,3-rhamnosyl/mannosyltransferase
VRIAVDARAAAEVPAGRGRYVRELLRHLAPQEGDWSVELLARSAWAFDDPAGRFRWRLVAGGDRTWPLRAAPAARGCDVLLASSSYLLAAVSPVPALSMVWDFAPFDRRFSAPRGALFERVTAPAAFRRARGLVAISEATREELAQRFPRTRGRTVVATPAAGDSFHPGRSPADAGALERAGLDRPYVLSVGTLEPRKNLPRLIEAFAGLPESLRQGRVLALAGARGWQTDATFAGVRQHAGVVTTLGFVPDEDLPALYRGATAVAYPSLYEGFGIPVLEALGCGAPVLTSDRSSMPEVAGEAALYADPESVTSIRDGLAALLGDAALRARLAGAGPVRARRFSWERSARVILDALRAVAAGGHPQAAA